MKHPKRLAAVVCALALAVSVAPMAALAAGDGEDVSADVVDATSVALEEEADSTVSAADPVEGSEGAAPDSGEQSALLDEVEFTYEGKPISDGDTITLNGWGYYQVTYPPVYIQWMAADFGDQLDVKAACTGDIIQLSKSEGAIAMRVQRIPEGGLADLVIYATDLSTEETRTIEVHVVVEPGEDWDQQAPDNPAYPSPYDTMGHLLPYTIKDGVMTFDGRPDLGEWYQLNVVTGDDVAAMGPIYGGTEWAMTIAADQLDPNDPLYDSETWERGPYWVRGDNGGSATSLLFSYPSDKTLNYQLSGNGSVRVLGRGIYSIQLSGPSTLTLGASNTTTLTNAQGATLSHTMNGADDNDLWSALTLVTDWLGGEANPVSDTIVAAVNNAIPNVKMYACYDIHLLDPAGRIFEIPEGESVTVTLPLPEGMGTDNVCVLHVADDGTVTDMNATVNAEARTVTFTTTHFSTFVIAEAGSTTTQPAGLKTESAETKKASQSEGIPATGDPGSVVAMLAAGSGAAALLGGRALRRRR